MFYRKTISFTKKNMARTKSHEGRTAYLPFDREGTVSDRAFIPYHKSLGKVE